MPPQNRILAWRLLLLAGSMLAPGCDTGAPSETGWSDPIAPTENKVEFITLDHDVHFAHGAKTVASGEAAGLGGFLKDNAAGGGDGDAVTVDSPKGPSSLAAARQAAVLAELKQLHVHARLAAATTLETDLVRVHVGHTVVTPPRCPDWSKPEADNPANSPSSNFGCATEANLAAMVADPADLVGGKSGGTANGAVLARGVELYRSGGLAKTLASSGGSSGSGAGSAGSGSAQ